MIALRKYQSAAVEAVYRHLRDHDDNPVVVLPTGCHAQGHPILMYDGEVKPVEEVAVGELVMGPDSRPRQVLALCRGEDDLYLVTPSKGEAFIVNGDHVLSLVCTNEGKREFACYRRGGEIDHITVREYLSRSKAWRHLRKLYRVCVEFPGKPNLPIPPYILGLLLGDGSFTDQTVSLTTSDEQTADAWIDYAHSINCGVTVHASGGRCPTFRLAKENGKHNVLTEMLAAQGLMGKGSGDKFIPQPYLVATRQDRLALLAGLMDSDGCSNKSGCDYTTKSRELATDIMFLVRSLGFAAHCTRKYCSCQTGAGGWFFRISVWGEFSGVPILLDRRRPSRRKQKKSILRSGFKVEPCGRGQYFGFVLNGDHLYVDGHFVVHHNSGKTPVMATICDDAVRRWDGRVLVLAHVKELLEQTAGTLSAMAPQLDVGVYSAGLRRRDTEHSVIIAGIQSVYRRAGELFGERPFDIILIDESHLIPPEGEGMYRAFLADAKVINPHVRTVGLTATPFRMTSGPICRPDHFLNSICYEISVKELIRDGYLCPLRTKAGIVRADTANLHVRGGEFIAGEVEELMDRDALVRAACDEIVQQTADRQSVLIFASGIQHGLHIVENLRSEHGVECGFVCGDTPAAERDHLIARFRRQPGKSLYADNRPLKYLCNVNVLTTGFDAPNVDCVAMLRPTMSPGLYYQMVGRGFRLCEGKADCLVLDFGGNVMRHGPVDDLRVTEPGQGNGEAPAKECPDCCAIIHAAYATCPECGYAFPPPEKQNHDAQASTEGVLSGQETITEYPVQDVYYGVHVKRDAPDDAPRTMRVEYRVGWNSYISEWICFEHTGYARSKAESWWRQRSNDPVPNSSEEAVELAYAGSLANTESIQVRRVAGEKYERIIGYQLGDKPPATTTGDLDLPEPDYVPAAEDDPIPF